MKQTVDNDLKDFVHGVGPVGQVTEMDVRLARQRITALENSRFLKGVRGRGRADVLESFLVGERGLTGLRDVQVEDAPLGWLDAHQVPASATVVTVLDEGRIPIFAGPDESLTVEMARTIINYGADLPSAASRAWRAELREIVETGDAAPSPMWLERGGALTGVPVPAVAPDWKSSNAGS